MQKSPGEAALQVLPPLRSLTARPVFEAVEWERVFAVSQKQKSPGYHRGFLNSSGQRAYLPGGCPPSTSAAEKLNCRVRNGNGCFLLAMATRKLGAL